VIAHQNDGTPPATRDRSGRFVAGAGSPNPGGRPKAAIAVQAAARLHAETAIAALATIAADPRAPAHSRVSAATALQDRGYGRPAQSVEVSRGPDTGRDLAEMSDAELIGFALQGGMTAAEIARSLAATTEDDTPPMIERDRKGE
jgi:hypothetical protein